MATDRQQKNRDKRTMTRRAFGGHVAGAACASALGCSTLASRSAQSAPDPSRPDKKTPRDQPMNVILIISDTVRYDYCGFLGNSWVRTPNLDAFAAQSAIFDHFYAASFPTGPMRKDVHSGRFTFPYASWGCPRPEGEPVVGEVFQAAGYRTAHIGDTENSPQYRFGFDYEEIVDNVPANIDDVPPEVELPASPEKLRFPMEWAQRIAREAQGWDGEGDRRVARSVKAAHRWLETQYEQDQPFFLWFDTFDPHEPWDQPQYYTDLYDPAYVGEELMEPAYEPAGYASPEEIRHMRCMYAAKLTMVDHWLGMLLAGIEHMGLLEDTAIVFTSDHGFYHGEHGLIGKVLLNRQNGIAGRWPLYDTISHAPLLIRSPDGPAGKHFGALCQSPDITATMLDLAGVAKPDTVQGRSLVPVMRGESRSVRPFAVSTLTHITDAEVRCPAAIRTDEHLYVYGGDEWDTELYDLERDPGEKRNILAGNDSVGRALHRQYVTFLEELGCPKVSLDARREYRPTPRSNLPGHRVI